MSKKLIPIEQFVFLKQELDSGDPRKQKNALQEFARLYRQNEILRPEYLESLEPLIGGLILKAKSDSKVVRWSLNCVAQFGRKDISGDYVALALKKYSDCPEIVAAGVAALCKLYPDALEDFQEIRKINPKIRILAALQNTDPRKIDIAKLRIDIDNEDAEILKLALITVGMNREVSNLFHPRYKNGEIVQKLCEHDDKIVSQYSVWAILENQKLFIHDLGLDTSRIDSYPVNVQAKILQLVAEKDSDYSRRHGIIDDGRNLPNFESREGLAKGIRDNYYDGLETIVIDWFDAEDNDSVRGILADHIARNSSVCSSYVDKTKEIFESYSQYKQQIFMAAERTPLYGELRRMNMQSQPEFFGIDEEFSAARLTQPQKKKVLFLTASPKNIGQLQLDEEWNKIRNHLRGLSSPTVHVDLIVESFVTASDIQLAITQHKPEVLHFSGHGNNQALCFEDGQGNAMLVSGKAFLEFAAWFKDIECVVLNACYSSEICEILGRRGMFLIGCNNTIFDAAASAFSLGFYLALADGCTYPQAYERGKNEISLGNYSGEDAKYQILT